MPLDKKSGTKDNSSPDSKDSNKKATKSTRSGGVVQKLFIPGSIVIAGFIIAAAIIYVGGDTNKKVAAETDAGDAKAVEQAGPQANDNVSIAAVTDADYIRGAVDAPVKIVVYSDFECPFCKRFHSTLIDTVSQYDDNDVAWVYRHFPLDSLHHLARTEAEASECVGTLGGNDAFWSFADAVYEATASNDGLDQSLVPKFAESAGVNKGEFQKCWDNKDYADRVESQYQEAVSAGGRGTPFSVIVGPDGQNIPISGAQSVDVLKRTIDGLLN